MKTLQACPTCGGQVDSCWDQETGHFLKCRNFNNGCSWWGAEEEKRIDLSPRKDIGETLLKKRKEIETMQFLADLYWSRPDVANDGVITGITPHGYDEKGELMFKGAYPEGGIRFGKIKTQCTETGEVFYAWGEIRPSGSMEYRLAKAKKDLGRGDLVSSEDVEIPGVDRQCPFWPERKTAECSGTVLVCGQEHKCSYHSEGSCIKNKI